MKRALIACFSVLAMIVGVETANAQANINPNVYPNNTSERYGAPAPWNGTPALVRFAAAISAWSMSTPVAVTAF